MIFEIQKMIFFWISLSFYDLVDLRDEVFSKTSLINTFKTVLKAKTATGSQACSFIKKETLAQVFFCEFCKIFNNTYFEEHP